MNSTDVIRKLCINYIENANIFELIAFAKEHQLDWMTLTAETWDKLDIVEITE